MRRCQVPEHDKFCSLLDDVCDGLMGQLLRIQICPSRIFLSRTMPFVQELELLKDHQGGQRT